MGFEMPVPNRKFPALPNVSVRYIWTEEQFYAEFDPRGATSEDFIKTETDGGRIYYYPPTGEMFTVLDDTDEVRNRIQNYLRRAKENNPRSKKSDK